MIMIDGVIFDRWGIDLFYVANFLYNINET